MANQETVSPNLYRNTLDRFQPLSKEPLKFEFDEEYKSYRTKFFDRKERIVREFRELKEDKTEQ